MVGTPPGTGGRKDLTESIVRKTLEFYRDSGAVFTNEAFYRLLGEYPDIVCDYRFINSEDRNVKESVFPYRGADSHRLALECAADDLIGDGKRLSFDTKNAKCGKLKSKALFAPANSDDRSNYRRAFLSPVNGKSYSDRDFDRVNAVLFPGGSECLEVYRWTGGRSDHSGEFQEGRGALCLTVYDRTLERFVVITAPATD